MESKIAKRRPIYRQCPNCDEFMFSMKMQYGTGARKVLKTCGGTLAKYCPECKIILVMDKEAKIVYDVGTAVLNKKNTQMYMDLNRMKRKQTQVTTKLGTSQHPYYNSNFQF
jgi:hypothetical protein